MLIKASKGVLGAPKGLVMGSKPQSEAVSELEGKTEVSLEL